MLSEKELNEVSQMIQHRLADDAAWVLIVVPQGGTVTVASKVVSRTEQLRMLIDGGWLLKGDTLELAYRVAEV